MQTSLRDAMMAAPRAESLSREALDATVRAAKQRRSEAASQWLRQLFRRPTDTGEEVRQPAVEGVAVAKPSR